jgi:hypothetical protein
VNSRPKALNQPLSGYHILKLQQHLLPQKAMISLYSLNWIKWKNCNLLYSVSFSHQNYDYQNSAQWTTSVDYALLSQDLQCSWNFYHYRIRQSHRIRCSQHVHSLFLHLRHFNLQSISSEWMDFFLILKIWV